MEQARIVRSSGALAGFVLALVCAVQSAHAHGTVVYPKSRVRLVYESNPQSPSFPLAQQAVALDGAQSYYTWMEVSRNVPQAVQTGLPPGFDYAPWMPDGQLASAGRVDPHAPTYPVTFAGLDQVSADWPTTPVTAGSVVQVDFLATAPHDPSVWDVWMTTPEWDAGSALRWSHMEFLGRPQPALAGGHYRFDLTVPANRSGHHVLWIAWQRDDPAGEVFVSASDVLVANAGVGTPYCVAGPSSTGSAGATIAAYGSTSVAANDLVLSAGPILVGKPGLFFHGSTPTSLPFGDGTLCVTGGLVRVPPAALAGASGNLVRTLDNGAAAGQGIAPGATRHFQALYRDPAGGPAGFNLSDAVSVTFTP